MTSTGFDTPYARDPSAYSCFHIDICTPPVEEEDEEIRRNSNVQHATDSSQHSSSDHSKGDRVQKPSSTTTSAPAGSEEPIMANKNMKSNVPFPKYVTERPPVRNFRPTVPEKKNQPQKKPAKEHSDQRYDRLFSSLRNISLPNVPSDKLETLIALSIRQEQASRGAGLDLSVRTMLRWNHVPSLSVEALPIWFVVLYEQADAESQKILLSFVSNQPARSVPTAFTVFKGDKGMYSPYQGLFRLVALLLFLFTLPAAPIITLLNKIRESRRAHSWNYTENEEQY